jgi:hypothetical protein
MTKDTQIGEKQLQKTPEAETGRGMRCFFFGKKICTSRHKLPVKFQQLLENDRLCIILLHPKQE